ncbi:400_t:CDS:2, partial [Racocetra persica]
MNCASLDAVSGSFKLKEESNYLKSPEIILKNEYQTIKYLIIKEGVYLPKHKLKYTQYLAKHPIPHNYVYLDKFVESDQSTSHATQLYCLEKRLLEFVEKEKENFFHQNDNIVLKQTKFEINGSIYNINYGKINKQKIELQIQAIVKLIDHNRISQDAYRSLARLDESLIRAGA